MTFGIIAIVFVVCCLVSHSLGIKEGLERGENRILRRLTRYTIRTKRKAPDGSVYSIN